jgi:uncharacterized protein
MQHDRRMDRVKTDRSISVLMWVAIALVIIGALNWGLVGLFNFNLVGAIFGGFNVLSRIVYVLVALAGVYLLATSPRFRRLAP